LEFIKRKLKLDNWIFELFLVIFICLYIIISFIKPPFIWFYWDILIFLCFIVFLLSTFNVTKGFVFKILSNKFLVYLGTISYGIYLYHLIIPWALENVINKYNLTIFNSIFLSKEIIFFSLVILFSHFSYYYFEIHFLKFKRKFTKN
jgi:peptidoglycan/LPS O-acetylase OafA/YrhL